MAASNQKNAPASDGSPTNPDTTKPLFASDEEAVELLRNDPAEFNERLATYHAAAAMDMADPRAAALHMQYAQVRAQLSARHETARIADALAGFTTAFDAMGAALEHIDRSLHQRPSS